PAQERVPLVEQALHRAAEVPLEVFERACGLLSRLESVQVPAKFHSDVAVAKALASAAQAGARENVQINLDSIQDEGFKAAAQSRLNRASAVDVQPTVSAS